MIALWSVLLCGNELGGAEAEVEMARSVSTERAAGGHAPGCCGQPLALAYAGQSMLLDQSTCQRPHV